MQHRILRTQTFFFLKLFGHLRDIPAKSRDIRAKKFDFPGFEGHTWVSPKANHIKASHPHFPRFRVRIFRIFCVFRVFVLRFSPQTLVFLGWEGRPHFPHFHCIGFESPISKIRPTGFRMTGLRFRGTYRTLWLHMEDPYPNGKYPDSKVWVWVLLFVRKLEKAVAVRNSLLEKFSGKFRRCWKMIRRFSGSTKCYSCQGLGILRQGKWLLENWPRLRERCWIFSSETATAFLSSSEFEKVKFRHRI